MRRLLIAAALAGLLVTACGQDARTGNAGTTGITSPAVSTAPPDTASPEQSASAPEALQFTAPVVGGGDLDLHTYARARAGTTATTC